MNIPSDSNKGASLFNGSRFGFPFAYTEMLRFAFHLHAGKERMVAERIIPNIQNKVVMDIGCGDGCYTVLYAEHASRVLAYDANPEAIRFATALHARANVTYQANVTSHIPSETVDIIIFNDSLELNEKWTVLLEEALAMLRPQGKIFITCPRFRRASWKERLILKAASFIQKLCHPRVTYLKGYVTQMIQTLESPFAYKSHYQRDFPTHVENFLDEKKLVHTVTPFLLRESTGVFAFLPRQRFGDHLLICVHA